MTTRRTSRTLLRMAGPVVVCLLAASLPALPGGPAPEAIPGPPPLVTRSADADDRSVFTIKVAVTGYSSTPDQTDSTPWITAANTRVRPGVLALSRDLLREYTPGAPFEFGDRVTLTGVGTFRVEDTMAGRYTKRADIWFTTRDEARRWGYRSGLELVKVMPGDAPGGVDDAVGIRRPTALAD